MLERETLQGGFWIGVRWRVTDTPYTGVDLRAGNVRVGFHGSSESRFLLQVDRYGDETVFREPERYGALEEAVQKTGGGRRARWRCARAGS